MRSTLRRSLAAVAVGALVVTGVACGDDDATDDTTAQATADTPVIEVGDQVTEGGTVQLTRVVAPDGPAIVAIHVDVAGEPGPIIGWAAVDQGVSDNVDVVLDAAVDEETQLWAMLHVDANEDGQLDYPDGGDEPVTGDDGIVMRPFQLMVDVDTSVNPDTSPSPSPDDEDVDVDVTVEETS